MEKSILDYSVDIKYGVWHGDLGRIFRKYSHEFQDLSGDTEMNNLILHQVNKRGEDYWIIASRNPDPYLLVNTKFIVSGPSKDLSSKKMNEFLETIGIFGILPSDQELECLETIRQNLTKLQDIFR